MFSKIEKKSKIEHKIINEYSYKRIFFNPNSNSPNIFLNKLEHRLHKYYNLYKSLNLDKK